MWTLCLVKVKVRSNKVSKSKCCKSVVRHTFYGSFWTQKTMVTFISKFDPSKGQYQVKLGSIRPNFKIQNFPTHTCLSYSVLSQHPKKCYSFFMYVSWKCQKLHFKKWSHHHNQPEVNLLFLKSTCYFLPLYSQILRYCFVLGVFFCI